MNSPLMTVVAQAGGLSPVQRGVRDHFQNGGSLVAVVLVMVVIALFVVAAYFISRSTERSASAVWRDDPDALFNDLLHRLGLGVAQRKVLAQIARDRPLPNPTVMLLSQAVFDENVRRWQEGGGAPTNTDGRERALEPINAAREALFPQAQG